ncbi:MAG TPA: TetR family transcriptional regulator [Pseudonocardiaceae bacterium]|nr:TetR family transcriptional regulator [Pseudonocardiaceae bacterium]
MSSAVVNNSSRTPTPACGLRERKKRRTREALVSAAWELFHTRGYERTTVREITDAVEMSERTFFRYFASKEDLVLSPLTAAVDAFIGQLRVRPPEERPVDALRNALHAAAGLLEPGLLESQTDWETHRQAVKLIESTPQLLAAHLMIGQRLTDALVEIVAERENVDPVTDRRPRIIAAVFCALMTTAGSVWRGDGGIETLVQLADEYLAELVPTFAQPWH